MKVNVQKSSMFYFVCLCGRGMLTFQKWVMLDMPDCFISIKGWGGWVVKCNQVTDVGRVRQSTVIHCHFKVVYSKLGKTA